MTTFLSIGDRLRPLEKLGLKRVCVRNPLSDRQEFGNPPDPMRLVPGAALRTATHIADTIDRW